MGEDIQRALGVVAGKIGAMSRSWRISSLEVFMVSRYQGLLIRQQYGGNAISAIEPFSVTVRHTCEKENDN